MFCCVNPHSFPQCSSVNGADFAKSNRTLIGEYGPTRTLGKTVDAEGASTKRMISEDFFCLRAEMPDLLSGSDRASQRNTHDCQPQLGGRPKERMAAIFLLNRRLEEKTYDQVLLTNHQPVMVLSNSIRNLACHKNNDPQS